MLEMSCSYAGCDSRKHVEVQKSSYWCLIGKEVIYGTIMECIGSI